MMWQIILTSSVVSAIISGIFSLIKDTRALKQQAKILQIEHNDRIFNQNQIQWLDNIRNCVSLIVVSCSKYNELIGLNDLRQTSRSESEIVSEIGDLTEISDNLRQQTTLLRTYLFHNEFYENQIMEVLGSIIFTFSKEKGKKISPKDINDLVEYTRQLIFSKMEEMR